MSRHEFRGAISSPRPASAWLMSLVSSATLWITGQIPIWIMLVQLATIPFSFLTRRRSIAFRRDPLCLNALMLGITVVTIRTALAGHPASISLAYFAALSQSLQLLDARPRKSEFLLVALSLFQIVLACNLTDSIFFPPLMIVFLVCVTWTLLAHTILVEAAEAGDPAAGQLAFSSDLRRMTATATSLALVLTLVLFVLLPRLDTRPFRDLGRGGALRFAGFSDRVSLGQGGPIRGDHSVVMRVQAIDRDLPAAEERYWRGIAFDHFDGTEWSISQDDRFNGSRPLSGVGRFGIDLLAASPERPLVAQRVVREPVQGGVLFTTGPAHRIEGPFQTLEQDRNGGLSIPGSTRERIRYTVWTPRPERDERDLESDHASLPLETARGGSRPALRYFALPRLDPRIPARAEEMTRNAPNDLARAHAIETHLRTTGRYTLNPPPHGEAKASPIEAFLLGDLAGHCEYFASAMVVLARSAGLPARLVTGFAGGVSNQVGGFVEVSRSDAHAWVEIHFENAGWVRFDPTPPSFRLRDAAQASLWSQLSQLGGALELWWFQSVIDFDSADQIRALRDAWQIGRGWRDGTEPAHTTQSPAFSLQNTPITGGAALIFLLAFSIGLTALLRARRSAKKTDGVPETYRRALTILARGGWQRAPAMSARGFLDALDDQLPPEGLDALRSITAQYHAERFGGNAPRDLSAELAALERAVDGVGLRNQPDVRQAGLGAP